MQKKIVLQTLMGKYKRANLNQENNSRDDNFAELQLTNDDNFINFEDPDNNKESVDMFYDDTKVDKNTTKSSIVSLKGSRQETNIPIILKRNMPVHNWDPLQKMYNPIYSPIIPVTSNPSQSTNTTSKDIIKSNNVLLDDTTKTKETNSYKNVNNPYIQQAFIMPGVANFPRVTGIPKSFLAAQIPTQIKKKDESGTDQLQNQNINYQGFGLTPNVSSNTSAQISPDESNRIYLNLLDMQSSEQYSPTDTYVDENEDNDGAAVEDASSQESGQKRLSAFQRLGPLTQPKKPKLTINLSVNKEQAVREVVEDSDRYVPVYERDDVINSEDPVVVKYLNSWAWKNIQLRKTAARRTSKTVMMMEKEQLEEEYRNDGNFIAVSVKGYPPSWTKENVLDAILENVKDNIIIPCFIEFTPDDCKFLVNRCRQALLALHFIGLSIRVGEVELSISISITLTSTKHIDFVPRSVLRNKISACYDDEEKQLDLSEFTLKSDISNFIYFPLDRISNQIELFSVQHINWFAVRELDLSHNRIKNLQNCNLSEKTPNLKHLNLSHNKLDRISSLMSCKGLPLKSLVLDGNPLCWDYIDGDYYIKVVRTLFPSLRKLDGITITLKGDMPTYKRNYYPESAKPVVERFIDVLLPLLDQPREEREVIKDMYHKDAILTVTYRKKMRYERDVKPLRNLFIMSRILDEDEKVFVHGADKISKLVKKWPNFKHDPNSIVVDVLYHQETSTILRMSGLLRVTSSSLADDEPLVAYTRTVTLLTADGFEYRIHNEMLYWDEATSECAAVAFRYALLPKNCISTKFEGMPDNEIKEHLIQLFMKITNLETGPSQKCLSEKGWNIKDALEYFVKLLKLGNIDYFLS